MEAYCDFAALIMDDVTHQGRPWSTGGLASTQLCIKLRCAAMLDSMALQRLRARWYRWTRLDDRDAHQGEQALAFIVVLPGDANCALAVLFHLLRSLCLNHPKPSHERDYNNVVDYMPSAHTLQMVKYFAIGLLYMLQTALCMIESFPTSSACYARAGRWPLKRPTSVPKLSADAASPAGLQEQAGKLPLLP